MSILEYAKSELDRIGMTEDGDEYNVAGREAILELVEKFSEQGHSGFSAGYVVNCLNKLLRWEPLAPLTGDDDEWTELDYDDNIRYQNNRCSRVFKDADGRAYDIDGKVFWEWYERDLEPDEEGYPGKEKYKSYFTCRESRVYVTFPYTPTTEYVERTAVEA